jgi:hypothetical protein|tara:strand:+ start:1154 stop:1378 length:225 start_codon:yes stop_codon:yes gene_type:complete
MGLALAAEPGRRAAILTAPVMVCLGQAEPDKRLPSQVAVLTTQEAAAGPTLGRDTAVLGDLAEVDKVKAAKGSR